MAKRNTTESLRGCYTRAIDWTVFDSLPSEIKRVFHDAFTNLAPNKESLDRILNENKMTPKDAALFYAIEIERVRKLDTAYRYGPNHPEA